ncbi:unnamed protein product, partial [Discosporangium mesarthrocarpum]
LSRVKQEDREELEWRNVVSWLYGVGAIHLIHDFLHEGLVRMDLVMLLGERDIADLSPDTTTQQLLLKAVKAVRNASQQPPPLPTTTADHPPTPRTCPPLPCNQQQRHGKERLPESIAQSHMALF